MKAVADTFAVARSNLIERVSSRAKSRRPYRKAGDDELLALIRRLVDERPTYGYRRIRRLINRQRKADGKPPVNGKRVLRIMQANKLTLERHTGRRPGRTHDGVVIALRLAGRVAEAKPIAGQGLELEPNVRIGELFDHALFHRGLMHMLMEGARLLGLPE